VPGKSGAQGERGEMGRKMIFLLMYVAEEKDFPPLLCGAIYLVLPCLGVCSFHCLSLAVLSPLLFAV